jgi:Na+-transporting methylmalonyl-CoA/oxaloacetate decarboxylase gamma subunit
MRNKKVKKDENISREQETSNETVGEAEILSDDKELIAVIAAAIAASENTSTDSFVVRSIRRR